MSIDKNKWMLRSPSVPNFHIRSTIGRSITDGAMQGSLPQLPAENQSNASNGSNNAMVRDNSSFSVIDLYVNDSNSADRHNTVIRSENFNEKENTQMTDTDDESQERLEINDSDTDEYDEDDELSKSVLTQSEPKPLLNSEGEFDRYGFKKQRPSLTEQEFNIWWSEYDEYLQRRKLKWKILLEKNHISFSDNSPPTIFPHHNEKLKRYVRKGIPADWRGNAWWYYSNGEELLSKNKGLYDSLIKKINKLTHGPPLSQYKKLYMDMEIIERDLNRTFPENIYFQRKQDINEVEPEKITALRRVLTAFALHFPSIGYCQSMNFLTGLLLLFLPEERVFWMLNIITTKLLPGVHEVNLEGGNVDQGVLMLCIKEYLPEMWSKIKRTCEPILTMNSSKKKPIKNQFLYKLPPLTLCTVSWFMSLFIGTVPIETTLRIWDCIFYEGSHFIFKISLGILRICESDSHSAQKRHERQDPRFNDEYDVELFQRVQSYPKRLYDVNKFFERTIFRKRSNFNNLDQEEIDRCRSYVKQQRRKYKEFVESQSHSQKPQSQTPDLPKKSFFHAQSADPKDLKDYLGEDKYGFKRSLTNVSWNNNALKEKMRQIRSKKDR